MKLFDTLQNLVSGLGTSKDKTVANTYVFNMLLPKPACDACVPGRLSRWKVIVSFPEVSR